METIITCWHLIAAAVLCGLIFNSLRYDALALETYYAKFTRLRRTYLAAAICWSAFWFLTILILGS